jgi:hypothetical protein
MLLLSWPGSRVGAAPAPAEPVPLDPSLQVDLDSRDDPQWELTRVELLLDSAPLAPASSDGPGTASAPLEAPRRLWSGLVAPGPHNLAAILFFRSRAPEDPVKFVLRTVRVETQHRWEAKPLRPLVLLITPVHPTRPPLSDAPTWIAVVQPPLDER